MAKKIIQGEIYGNWKVIEANIINPNTVNKRYKDKPVYYKCLCLKCNESTKICLAGDVRAMEKKNSVCKSCASQKRAEKERKIKTGQKYGKLTVIGDGGYENQRHYSIFQCDCGRIIKAKDNSVLSGNKSSCGCLSSKGELIIMSILDKHNIKYIHDSVFSQYFEETGHKHRFDFIIYNEDNTINRFIEFDGRQHVYGPDTDYWGRSTDTLFSIQKKDKAKNDFCLKHNYKLIRIPYTELNKITIETLLDNTYLIKE